MELKQNRKQNRKLTQKLSIEKNLKIDIDRFLSLILEPEDLDENFSTILIKYFTQYLEIEVNLDLDVLDLETVINSYNRYEIKTRMNLIIKESKFKEFLEYQVKKDISLFLKERGMAYMDDKLEIYREIGVEEEYEGEWASVDYFEHSSGSIYDTKELGIYWSYNEDSASAIWGEDEGTKYFIKAKTTLNSMDIEHSFLLNYENYEFNSEKEIRMVHKKPLEEVNIFIATYEQEKNNQEFITSFKRSLKKIEIPEDKEYVI